MTILINIVYKVNFVRKTILGDDLISLIESAGNEDSALNFKYIALISLLSTEESCCLKLRDYGALKILVALQDARNDIGKDLIAATFHNLSLKRASLGPGQLTTMIDIARGTKTIRVLWLVRCLANLSAKNKSRTILAKERKVCVACTYSSASSPHFLFLCVRKLY